MIFIGFVLFLVLIVFGIEFIGFWAKVENAQRKKEGRKSIADSITIPKLFLTLAVLILINLMLSQI